MKIKIFTGKPGGALEQLFEDWLAEDCNHNVKVHQINSTVSFNNYNGLHLIVLYSRHNDVID